MTRRTVRELRRVSGARLLRVSDGAGMRVDHHTHAWPVISTFVMGRYRNRCALGDAQIGVPSAIFYRANEGHENDVGPEGLEQVDIEFDPRWLGTSRLGELGPVRRWIGGPAAAAAQALARTWMRCGSDADLRGATGAFVDAACTQPTSASPPWLAHAVARLASPATPSTLELARELRLHPGWLAQSYRAAVGEGVRDTVRRHRVQRAAHRLRVSGLSIATIAADVGFCDQSHMNRAFHAVLGRTPACVREEWVGG